MTLIPPSAPGAAQREIKPRLLWMAGVASFCFFVLLVRLYQLQILRGEEYKGKADENFVKELRVPADRGFIFDRNKRILVDSRPSYDVTLTPSFCRKECDEVLARLSAMLSLAPEEITRVRDHLGSARGLVRFRPFTVKVDISRDELDVVSAHKLELNGVEVMPTPHRNYRYGALGAHLLGYMNEVGGEELDRLNAELPRTEPDNLPYQMGDYVGRRGLEKRYQATLRGVEGKKREVVDAKGNAKADSDLIPSELREEPSRPGKNLVLSLDWRLQELAEKTFPGRAGAVVALDPKTGFLLALIDRPSPDPNKMSGRISRAELKAIHSDRLKPELFRAIQQHYHPGSTFKMVTTLAALEEGILKPGGTVYCPGYYRLGSYSWRCDKDSGHGTVDLTHALGASCNVFYYHLGDRLGSDRIAKYAHALGLGHPTGLDMTGEISGVIPDQAWHDKYTPGGYRHGFALNTAIGQGDVNVTPLQLLVAYTALATGGTVWKPQVVMRIEDDKGEVVKEFAPVQQNRLQLKPESVMAIQLGLKAAVNLPFGTAYRSRLKEVEMAGKTGTAQVVKLGAKRLKAWEIDYFERDHAWFVAFAPADDPRIAVVVLNEHSGFGASNAAPTAAAMIKYYLELLEADALERAGAPRTPEVVPPEPRTTPPPVPPSPDGRHKLGGSSAEGGRLG
jgi:penicillin-binding protein 2